MSTAKKISDGDPPPHFLFGAAPPLLPLLPSSSPLDRPMISLVSSSSGKRAIPQPRPPLHHLRKSCPRILGSAFGQRNWGRKVEMSFQVIVNVCSIHDIRRTNGMITLKAADKCQRLFNDRIKGRVSRRNYLTFAKSTRNSNYRVKV